MFFSRGRFTTYFFVATAAALFFVAWQTILTRRQLNASLRAWLGVSEEGLQKLLCDQLLLKVQNYGTVPTTLLRTVWQVSKDVITRRNIQALENSFQSESIAIFPNQVLRKTLPLEEPLLTSAKKQEESMYVGIIIKYKYSDKWGEYGIIFRYGKILTEFVVEEVWTN